MRISDWSSDVCSSDLRCLAGGVWVMKGLIAKRERIVRARRVQHLLATVESARAQNEAMALEQNAQRVRMVRDELFEVGAITSGAALASHRELRSEGRRGGKECVSKCNSRWSTGHEKKT